MAGLLAILFHRLTSPPDTAIETAGDNINVDVQAIIEANLNAIAAALGTGAGAITDAIAAAGGNIGNAVAGFGLQQFLQLVNAVNQLVALLNNLNVELGATIENLGDVAPAVLTALADELAAIRNAIQPFVAPIQDVVAAVRRISITANLLLGGVSGLVPGLLTILGNLLGGL